MSGIIGFMIFLATTTVSKNSIEFTDMIISIIFAFLIVIFEYMRKEPNPFFKEDEDKNDKNTKKHYL